MKYIHIFNHDACQSLAARAFLSSPYLFQTTINVIKTCRPTAYIHVVFYLLACLRIMGLRFEPHQKQLA